MAADLFLFIHVFFMVTLCSTKRCRVAQKTIVSTKEIYHIEVKRQKKLWHSKEDSGWLNIFIKYVWCCTEIEYIFTKNGSCFI